ncbi:MAG: hypothetical protein D3916_17925, partial [Candidatus Electrothrix sp. MAN1_4]|nr:hypothetical protein [Candidatus Electrothrix sp. MAN1_4]
TVSVCKGVDKSVRSPLLNAAIACLRCFLESSSFKASCAEIPAATGLDSSPAMDMDISLMLYLLRKPAE